MTDVISILKNEVKDLVHWQGKDLKRLWEQANRLLLVQDFHFSIEEFISISDKMMSSAWTHYSPRRKKTQSNQTVIEALYGEQKVYLHHEFAYVPFRPDIIFFFCQVPSVSAGETTICEKSKFFASLSKGLKNKLFSQSIQFQHRWPTDFLVSHLKADSIESALKKANLYRGITIQEANENYVQFNFVTPGYSAATDQVFALSVEHIGDENPMAKSLMTACFQDGSEIEPWMIEEFKQSEFLNTQKIKWNEGEFVVLDNNRYLHGREAFTGPRQLFTRFGHSI